MSVRFALSLLHVGVLGSAVMAEAAPAEPAVYGRLQSFDYQGVQLLPGRFQEQFDAAKAYFLAIPNDNLLKPFRAHANMDAPGEDLGGWYNYPATFAQWLSAYAKMYRLTGDPAVIEKIEYLLTEWGKTIEQESFFLSIAHYGYDKLVGGLVDAYQYAGQEKALDYLNAVTDFAMKTLKRRRLPATRIMPLGGDGSEGIPDTEWYTLSENLYRAYLLTGKDKYRDFAEIWHYTTFWDALARGEHAMTGMHAYSHVNSLSGAAMAYVAGGQPQYFKTITNAYDVLKKTQWFSTGGFGPTEMLVSDAYGARGECLYWQYEIRRSFETPCCTWAAFKLSRYLLELTGEARYGEWVERLLYNGIGAALPMGENGKTYYYSDYKMAGASKEYFALPGEGADRWPCCSGTYPNAVTEYHNLIYFHDPDGVYVNLYVPSRLDWNHAGQKVTLEMTTSFPESGNVRMEVATPAAHAFHLSFRIPEWIAAGVVIKVNGKRSSMTATPGGWARIERKWQQGDVVELELHRELRFEAVDNYHPTLAALVYGPVVLVADKQGVLSGDMTSPATWIHPVQGAPLQFETDGQPQNKRFRPYYDCKEKEPYFMYQEIDTGASRGQLQRRLE